MKRLLWIGLLFISISWLFFLNIFVSPNINVGLLFLSIGLLFNILAFWKVKTYKVNKKYLIFLIPLILILFFIDFPFNLGAIILLISCLIYLILVNIFKLNKLGWISLGIGLSGLIIILQTALLPFIYIISSHYHRVDLISPVVSFFANLFGLQTSVNDGILYTQTNSQNFPITITLEKFGFFPWVMILIGALLILFFSPKIKTYLKNILLFLALSFFYLIIRLVFLIFIFTTVNPENLDIFWDYNIALITFLPFILLLMHFIPLHSSSFDLSCFKKFRIVKKKNVLAIFLIFLFVFSMVGTFAFYDPGFEKNGKILVDEFHSDWEPTEIKFDKDWYGKISTYNAYSLFEWLNYTYSVDKNLNETITSDLLGDYSILVVKCPTNSFSKEEIDVIVKFVEAGGGLYLIGDHTNVFGMNFYLNKISERFGIIFNYDSTHDLETSHLSIYNTQKLLPHPIIQHTNVFNFLSSCTLDVPINAENVIIGYGLTNIKGTYATDNFFRTSAFYEPDIEQGLFIQTASVKYGKGRVVAFTDSTCISNFCVLMEEYPSFFLMTTEYLNRSNEYSYINNVFIIVGLASLILSFYLLKKENKSLIIVFFIAAGFISFSISAPIFSQMNYTNYNLPKPHSDYNSICFVEEHSDFIISPRTSVMDVDQDEIYNNFYIWTQRINNTIPSMQKSLDNALEEGDAIVIINPVKSFTESDIEDINEYLESGGKVLLMDGVLNGNSTANELLKKFNINVEIYNESENSSFLKINGNKDTYYYQNNYANVSITNISKGVLVVVVDSSIFSNSVMGGAFTVPTTIQRQVYDIEFYILENIFFADSI